MKPYAKCGRPSDYVRSPGVDRVRTEATREKDRRITRTKVASLHVGGGQFLFTASNACDLTNDCNITCPLVILVL